jgi:hypothetical protein
VAVHGARTAAGDTGDRYFSARSPASDVPMIAAFRERLGETGYIEGKNVAIEFSWGLGGYDRAQKLADKLGPQAGFHHSHKRRRDFGKRPPSAFAGKADIVSKCRADESRNNCRGLLTRWNHSDLRVTKVVRKFWTKCASSQSRTPKNRNQSTLRA